MEASLAVIAGLIGGGVILFGATVIFLSEIADTLKDIAKSMKARKT